MNGTFKNLALTTALLSVSFSAYAADTDPCAGVNALARSRSADKSIASLVSSGDEQSQFCAIRAAGETKNLLAADALLANVENYVAAVNKGFYEDNLRARLKAMESIWALGEMAEPQVMQKLLKFYKDGDDVVRINLLIGAGKKKGKDADEFLYNVAANTAEANAVRAAAYEMLDANRSRMPEPRLSHENGMEKGDLIYTGGIFGIPQGWVGDLTVGHAGLYGGTEVKDGKIVMVIYDCVPDNFKPVGGVRKIFSYTNFTHQNRYPFFGNRTTKPKPTAAQRDRIIAAAAAKVGHHYSDSHFTQKGPEDFDCVGYTEYAYEAAGLNPTPDNMETGWGWPLTPAEQLFATTANGRPVSPLIVPNQGIIVPNQNIIVPHQGIITGGFNALTGAFGMGAVRSAEAPAPVFEAVN